MRYGEKMGKPETPFDVIRADAQPEIFGTREIIHAPPGVQRFEPLFPTIATTRLPPGFERRTRQKHPLEGSERGKIRANWGGEFLAIGSMGPFRGDFHPFPQSATHTGPRKNALNPGGLGGFVRLSATYLYYHSL